VTGAQICICNECGKQHTTPAAKNLSHIQVLELFCKSAEYHLELERHFTIPAHDVYQIVPGTNQEAKDSWNRLILAASFRKFVVDSSESVYLPKVLESLTFFGAQRATPERIRDFRKQLNEIRAGGVILGKYSVGDGREWTAWQVVDALLNGMFLHADLRVSSKASEWNAWMKDQSLFEWLGSFRQEFLALYESSLQTLEELHGNSMGARAATGPKTPWELKEEK
jgi:hypothetical protein